MSIHALYVRLPSMTRPTLLAPPGVRPFFMTNASRSTALKRADFKAAIVGTFLHEKRATKRHPSTLIAHDQVTQVLDEIAILFASIDGIRDIDSTIGDTFPNQNAINSFGKHSEERRPF